MKRTKITIVGAGSVYTALMIRSLALACQKRALPGIDLDLMDITDDRLKIMEGLARKMIKEANADVNVRRTTHLG